MQTFVRKNYNLDANNHSMFTPSANACSSNAFAVCLISMLAFFGFRAILLAIFTFLQNWGFPSLFSHFTQSMAIICLHYVCGQFQIQFINRTPFFLHTYLAIVDSQKSQFPLCCSRSSAHRRPTKPYPSIRWAVLIVLCANL